MQHIGRSSRTRAICRATWYEGTAQLLRLTEFKSLLFALFVCFLGFFCFLLFVFCFVFVFVLGFFFFFFFFGFTLFCFVLFFAETIK